MTIRETVLSQQRQAFAELLILQLNDEPQKGRAVAMLHVAREGGDGVVVATGALAVGLEGDGRETRFHEHEVEKGAARAAVAVAEGMDVLEHQVEQRRQ